ncbi:hypothetical protein PSTT_01963 [Puccinia striiformis]|uniref:CobW C-terminal domain-containing protein n=2 Tax=Puccinia striiformis TaxID=27350 RepID=A0A2S4W1L8_9BASI|nr:hypothetical protein PSTT_01963 [Puccinia striiformis]
MTSGTTELTGSLEIVCSSSHIIVETTGIADPSQIALLFWIDSALESLLYLDGIVTVVDCVHLEKQLEEEAAANSGTVTKLGSVMHSSIILDLSSLTPSGYSTSQIAVADSLYLSKIDLVSLSKLEPMKKLIQRMNDSALLSQSNDDLEKILPKVLSLDSFSTYRGLPKSLTTLETSMDSGTSNLMARLNRQVGNSTDPDFRTTHDNFSTITINLPVFDNVSTDDSKFDRTFRKLLWEGILGEEEKEGCSTTSKSATQQPSILRAKGLLKDHRGDWFILQAVRETYEIQPVHPDVSIDEQEQPKLVLIGKGLDNQLGQRFLNEIS